MRYTQNCEIWHGASLGTLIMIQVYKVERPFEDHVLAIKDHIWPFLGKGATMQCKIWHETSPAMIKIQEEPI